MTDQRDYAVATLICCVRQRAHEGARGYLLDEGLARYPGPSDQVLEQRALDLLDRAAGERYDDVLTVEAFSDLEPDEATGACTTALGYLRERGVAFVACRFCGEPTPAATAHLHQARYVGQECWDERLRASE